MKTYDLGFLGGGQLARMSIQAAQRMGVRCLSLDPGADTPASQIAPAITGRLDDPAKIAELMSSCEAVTLENEFIPAPAILEALQRSSRDESALMPGVHTLANIQDKLRQREAMTKFGVPSPQAVAIDPNAPQNAFSIGWPMVLKARFGGYDGKGTRYAHNREEFESFRDLWSGGGWMAEEFVPFRRELSVMVAIDAQFARELPTMETIQSNHVCDVTYPASRSAIGPANTAGIANAAIRAVGGRGLFGVELFELPDGRVLVNEIAPRPHNTGHYTLDWGALSQFDIHVRLALGLAVPERISGSDVAMANLLGQADDGDFRLGVREMLREFPDVRFHWYGKRESRPGRKMGHLNRVLGPAEPAEAFLPRLREARACFFRSLKGGSAALPATLPDR